MKILFLITITTVFIVWSAKPSIEFSPFKLSFSNGYYTIGLLLVLIGLSFVQYQGKLNGKKQAYDWVIKEFKKDKVEKL